jgi:putative ABC transport system permease protein
VWLIGARDLQFRRRRVLIAVLATSVVFAMTLLMAGMSKGLDDEIDRLVGSFKAQTWAVARGASGPFTTTKFLSADDQKRVSDTDGVRAAAPVIVGRGTIGTQDLTNVNLLGTPSRGFGAPEITEGRAARQDGEVVVDDHLDVDVGDRLDVSGLDARVVGKSGDSRYNFGVNTVYLTLDDARALTFAGADLASAVIMRGRPSDPIPGVAILTNDDVKADQARTLSSGKSTIDLIQVLLWFVAAGIIALMVYLTALERVRDFAVLKATGASNGTLFGALLLQAVVLSLGAALVAAVLTILLAPMVPFAVVISTTTYLILAVVAIVLGAIASLAGLRRAIGVDPAIAFGGA